MTLYDELGQDRSAPAGQKVKTPREELLRPS